MKKSDFLVDFDETKQDLAYWHLNKHFICWVGFTKHLGTPTNQKFL